MRHLDSFREWKCRSARWSRKAQTAVIYAPVRLIRLPGVITFAAMTSQKPAVILGVPYDASSSFRRGPVMAPARIREALWSSAGNSWTETLVDISDPAVLVDAGDLAIEDARSREIIEAGVAKQLANGRKPILLGGDHSITYPILRAVGVAVEPLTILHIDAHADLYEEFEGDRFSHACPFARIMEERLAARLIQVGIRTLTSHQRTQAQRFGVEIIDMRAWARGARPDIAANETVYLSVDLDGVDPAFAPGVSHPEPGGLAVRDVLSLIQDLEAPMAGADIVECNPAVDPTGITSVVAAKFLKEIAAAMHCVPEPWRAPKDGGSVRA
jgi:arginase